MRKKFKQSNLVRFIARTIPDQIYIKIKYRLLTGEHLNLNKPIKFNEKIQWLKIHDRKKIYTSCVDKYEVKKIMEKLLGVEHVIPTIGVWNNIKEVNIDKLPEKFVLKTTHDSGSVFICNNKKEFDFRKTFQEIEKKLNENYFWHGREWPYKNVKPRIIAEPLLVDESGYELKDYKVFVFEGKAMFIQVDYDRFTSHHRNFYDLQWNYVPFTTMYPTNPKYKIEKPEKLIELISYSEKISFFLNTPHFVRVDFYISNQNVYFGEITFYHGSGTEKFYPEEYNVKLGELMNIIK